MKAKREIASFVLRFTQDIWPDMQGEPHVEWRGHICYVQNGRETRFTELAELIHFIQQTLLKCTLGCVAQEDQMVKDKTVRESFKLWERLSGSATDQAHLLQTIVALQAQVGALTTKIGKLEEIVATQAPRSQP